MQKILTEIPRRCPYFSIFTRLVEIFDEGSRGENYLRDNNSPTKARSYEGKKLIIVLYSILFAY